MKTAKSYYVHNTSSLIKAYSKKDAIEYLADSLDIKENKIKIEKDNRFDNFEFDITD